MSIGMPSRGLKRSQALFRPMLVEESKLVTSTLFPMSCTCSTAGTKSLSPETSIATSYWSLHARTTISHPRATSTSFCLSSLQDRIGGLGAGFNEGAQSFDLSTQDKAQAVLAGIDAYITYVDGRRGEAGAQMKRLESTIRNQSSMHENESSARMRMRDADYAKETSELASAQVRQNVSAQMLMQANTQTDFVLALLR